MKRRGKMTTGIEGGGGGIEGGRRERQKEEEKEYIKSRLGCLTTWYTLLPGPGWQAGRLS